MGKEGKIERKEDSLDYRKAEAFDLEDLVKEHNFHGKVRFKGENHKERENVNELQRAFVNYYEGELGLRLNYEQRKSIFLTDIHDNWFSSIINKIEKKEDEYGKPLDSEYLEIYRSIEGDVRDYFQMGWDDCQEKLKKSFPEIWKGLQQDKSSFKRTKDLTGEIWTKLYEKEQDMGKADELMRKVSPSIEIKDVFRTRKEITEKYIDLIKDKKPEMFKKYIQLKEAVQANPSKGLTTFMETQFERLRSLEE